MYSLDSWGNLNSDQILLSVTWFCGCVKRVLIFLALHSVLVDVVKIEITQQFEWREFNIKNYQQQEMNCKGVKQTLKNRARRDIRSSHYFQGRDGTPKEDPGPLFHSRSGDEIQVSLKRLSSWPSDSRAVHWCASGQG